MDDVIFQRKLLDFAGVKGISPSAKIVTHGMGGMGKSIWLQPHNARFYAFFKGSGHGWRKDGELLNNGNEVLFRDFDTCDIRLKRIQAEILVKILDKDWFQVERSEVEVASNVLKGRLRDEALRVWQLFCKKYDVQSDMQFVNERVEIGRMSDLGRLNPAVVVSGMDWKKLYAYKEEALSWDALVSKTQEEGDDLGRIEGKIDAISSERISFNQALKLYTEQIQLHLKVEERQLAVQEATEVTLEAIRQDLKDKRQSRAKQLLNEWGW